MARRQADSGHAQSRDGTLVGEYTYWLPEDTCAGKLRVTFTHTSADPAAHASIADPAAQPPRVTSPAEALHGRYHKTATYANGNTNDYDYLVQTYCLRTGQRCFSAWTPPDSGGSSTFVFEDGRWVRADAYDTDCTTGDRTHVDITEQHPLPQPPQDPITLLTGHGHKTNGGACPFNADFDSTLQRTGD